MTDQEQRDLWTKLNDLSERLTEHEINCARDNAEIKADIKRLGEEVAELRKWVGYIGGAILLGGGGGFTISQFLGG